MIDPRTLVPLDLETIVESVSRTHRLVVAHEAVVHGGFGAELAAQVQAPRSTSSTRRSRGWAHRSRRFRSARRSRTPGYRAATKCRSRPRNACNPVIARVPEVVMRPDSSRTVPLSGFVSTRGPWGYSLALVSILGHRVLRTEDAALPPRPRARYVENLPLEGALHVTFVRSPIAHARSTASTPAAARRLPGVAGLHRRRRRPRPMFAAAVPASTAGMARPLVATDVVRFVGEIVAVVVSEDRAHGRRRRRARDRRLRPAAGRRRSRGGARGRGAALPRRGHERRGARRSRSRRTATTCSTAATSSCPGTLVSQRMAPCPLEPRSTAAEVGDRRPAHRLARRRRRRTRTATRSRASSGSSRTRCA